MVLCANHTDRRGCARQLQQVAQSHSKCLRNSQCHGERRVGLLPLDLAQHRPTHPAGIRERLQRPTACSAEIFHPRAEMPVDGINRCGWSRFSGSGRRGHVCDILQFPFAYRIPVSSILEIASGILVTAILARKPKSHESPRGTPRRIGNSSQQPQANCKRWACSRQVPICANLHPATS